MDKGPKLNIPPSIVEGERPSQTFPKEINSLFEFGKNELEEARRAVADFKDDIIPFAPARKKILNERMKQLGGKAALFFAVLMGSQLISGKKVEADNIQYDHVAIDALCAARPNTRECDLARAMEDGEMKTYELSDMVRNEIYNQERKKDEAIRKHVEELRRQTEFQERIQEEVSDVGIDWANTEDCRNYDNKLASKYDEPETINLEKGSDVNRTVKFKSYYNNKLAGDKADKLRYVTMIIDREDSDIVVEVIQAVGADTVDPRDKDLKVLYSKGGTRRALVTPNLFGSMEEYRNFIEKVTMDFMKQWEQAKEQQIRDLNKTIEK